MNIQKACMDLDYTSRGGGILWISGLYIKIVKLNSKIKEITKNGLTILPRMIWQPLKISLIDARLDIE